MNYSEVIFNVNNIKYKKSTDQIQEGDLVFDTKDKTYGVCDMIIGDKMAIKFGCVAELAVPMKRCFKLIPTYETNSLN